ncbi:tyrosine-type recombinase/integrase [Catenuloplanes sp. NPDC051500]|uniref:tyrosine-type recombinase/integrase n=1 Tax=Catenuloplanes sp. NPDC051500 TaxID=3363959 RepID=UPI0037A9A46C
MADAATVEAALKLLGTLGVSVEDLARLPVDRPAVPTFSEFLPRVRSATTAGTGKVYESYWRMMEERWGGRRLDEVTVTEIASARNQVQANARVRRTTRGGTSAGEHFVAAARRLFRFAVDDGLLSENPALKVEKPRRQPSLRMAIGDARLAEIYDAAITHCHDPSLATLLIRFHTETACRRGGALALRPMDLDEDHLLVRLFEKGGRERWQPVSRTLMDHLLLHVEEREAGAGEPLFRSLRKRPITRKFYEVMWTAINARVPWAARNNVSMHWIRHTTLTWVERRFGRSVASAYAGHAQGPSHDGTISVYTKASLAEVAAALAALVGEPHPLVS